MFEIPQGMARKVFDDKYARTKQDGTKESWVDVANRVSAGNALLFKQQPQVMQDYYKHVTGCEYEDNLRSLMQDGILVTAGRHLQHADENQLQKSGDRMMNCVTSITSFLNFWLLMQGCGVGRLYSSAVCKVNWDFMPNVRLVLDVQHPDYEPWIEPLHEAKHIYSSESQDVRWYKVKDSAIGWMQVITILETAASEQRHKDKLFIFDFSDVRESGKPIRGMQNRPASGPVPFIRSMMDVLRVKGAGMQPWKQALVIDHYLAQAVLSGGVRRCLAGDTLVSTSTGMRRIDEISVGDIVYTGNRNWKRVSATFNQGVQDCVRVSHQDGYIDCTPNHRLATLLPNGKDYEWKFASELKTGDRLMYFRHESQDTTAKLPEWSYVNPPHSTTSTDIIIPELTEDVAWFIGLVQGDGYVSLSANASKGHVTVACHEDDSTTISRCAKVMQEFGTNVIISKKKNERCVLVRTHSNQLAQYMQNHVKKPNTPLHVPRFITTAPTNIKMSYVTGLLDSDGSIRTRPITLITSIYGDFVRQVQSLLFTCGVETRIRVCSRSTNPTHKQKYALTCITNASKRKFSTYNNTKHITETRFSGKANSFATVSEKLNVHFDRNAPVNIDAYERHINPNNDIVPLTVKSVSSIGSFLTYDIEVEDDHSFFANGVLSHNSARISCIPWTDAEQNVIDFITCKAGGQYFWSANNSVLVDEDFWRDVHSEKSCKARRIFDAIISASFYDKTGEPGFINVDKLKQNDTGIENLTAYNYLNPVIAQEMELHPKTYMMLDDIIRSVKKLKFQMIVNPCVTADTLIDTTDGPQRVANLVGKRFYVPHMGQEYKCDGFYSVGKQPCVEVEFSNGSKIVCSTSHKFDVYGVPTEVSSLKVGDLVTQNLQTSTWSGKGTVRIVAINNAGTHEVYNCTVNQIHTYTINGIVNHQCGEISLHIVGGYCCIGDINLANLPKDQNKALQAVCTQIQFLINVNKMRFLYEFEVNRTNRIGVGLIGVHEFAWNQFGYTFQDLLDENKSRDFWNFIEWMRVVGEAYLEGLKDEYPDFVVPHTAFTIKPAGTTAKIMKVTEGWHLPAYQAMIRYVQYRKDDPRVPDLIAQGYPFKDVSASIRDTVVVGYPTINDLCDSMADIGVTPTCAGDVSMEQHFQWIALGEKHWLGDKFDNQISYTAKFSPDTTYEQYRKMMKHNMPLVKCCSVMPQLPDNDIAYAYQPETRISIEEYHRLMRNINQQQAEDYDEKSLECAGGACPIEQNLA